jgi:putative transposase
VVRWQRERFRQHWGGLSSKPGRIGRPPIKLEIRRLIQTLAKANPLWRAPRIHGELQKLGIAVSERTVSRVLRSISRRPSQNWRTFLRNHMGETVAIDFFTVATIRLRVLFVFLVMEHGRRRVLHFGITEHPTAEWTGQQMVECPIRSKDRCPSPRSRCGRNDCLAGDVLIANTYLGIGPMRCVLC